MNAGKRWISALLAGLMLCMTAIGEEATVAPTIEATSAPTAAPTPTAVPEPTAEATPTMEPTPTAEPEPTAEPTPTVEPTPTSTAAPTPTVEPEPTSAPTATPTPAPTGLEIKPEGNAQLTENIWRIVYTSAEDPLIFRWNPIESALFYAVCVTDAAGNEIYVSQETETNITLAASIFGTDVYQIAVSAWDADAELMREAISIQLIPNGQGGDFPGGFPGGGFPGGGFPSGGFSGGGAPGGAEMEAQGFHITPGEALTDRHASGNRDMRTYGTLDIEPVESEMHALTMADGTELSITLDDAQSGFYAALDGDVLRLTPVADGKTWQINALVLKLLNRSGVSALRVSIGEAEIEIATDWQLQGMVYGRLSAAGYVSKDYTLIITAEEIRACVDGQYYQINANNELIGG